MINIKYHTTPKEFATAALTYIEKIPAVAVMLFLMNTSCWLALLGYILKFHGSGYTSTTDKLAAVCAILWIFGRRRLNKFILKRSFKKKKIEELKAEISIDKNRISWKGENNQRKHLLWNKVPKVYLTKKGYIIPRVLHGPLNSTFIWLPKTSFPSLAEENTFLDYITSAKVKLKRTK